jgi:hypothetical protein
MSFVFSTGEVIAWSTGEEVMLTQRSQFAWPSTDLFFVDCGV